MATMRRFAHKMVSKSANRYDGIILLLILVVAALLLFGYYSMHGAYSAHSMQTLSLSWQALPYYSLRTTMRLLFGLFCSLLFAVIAGTLAAKNRHAERLILPFINFMESVPLLGFLTFSTAFFMALYPHNVMGIEYAAIFAVFTGQAWNMALTLYQTLRVVPPELLEMGRAFQMSHWQRYWKIELPYSIPGLLWNTMVSQSAAWFALVASEAIPVGDSTVNLPGVGAYIQVALDHANSLAIIYAILALIINIVLLDQLLFRPLVKWSEKFKYEQTMTRQHHSAWLYQVVIHSQFCRYLCAAIRSLLQRFDYHKRAWTHTIFDAICRSYDWLMTPLIRVVLRLIWYSLVAVLVGFAVVALWAYIPDFSLLHLSYLMLLTTLRVAVAMLLSLIIFVPLGVVIGLNPRWVKLFQPIIQILAALPPNILYPLMAALLITFHQSLGWWSIGLIMLGTQWYILFNVIAGIATLPQELRDVTTNFNIKGLLYWRHVIIPAIFPYIVTGIISAAGGAWNADITAEFIQWGKTTLHTPGLGAYIAQTTNNNLNHKAALGCSLMCVLVALCITFIWRPLYRLAETRYSIR